MPVHQSLGVVPSIHERTGVDSMNDVHVSSSWVTKMSPMAMKKFSGEKNKCTFSKRTARTQSAGIRQRLLARAHHPNVTPTLLCLAPSFSSSWEVIEGLLYPS